MAARDKRSKSTDHEDGHETVTVLSDRRSTAQSSTSSAARHYTIPPVASAYTVHEARTEVKDGTKKLIVGRGISLDCKIVSCDRLIIDGRVEAELQDCHTVEITKGGTFKGAAEVASAEISGHFDGSLTVRGNLLIRATGRVTGTVRYGSLRLEDGGEINGDVQRISGKVSEQLDNPAFEVLPNRREEIDPSLTNPKAFSDQIPAPMNELPRPTDYDAAEAVPISPSLRPPQPMPKSQTTYPGWMLRTFRFGLLLIAIGIVAGICSFIWSLGSTDIASLAAVALGLLVVAFSLRSGEHHLSEGGRQ